MTFRTLFDVQNVWGRTAVDTQKPLDSSPLSEMPRQDVNRSFSSFFLTKDGSLILRKRSVLFRVFHAIYLKNVVVVSSFLLAMRCNRVPITPKNGKSNGIPKNVGKIH